MDMNFKNKEILLKALDYAVCNSFTPRPYELIKLNVEKFDKTLLQAVCNIYLNPNNRRKYYHACSSLYHLELTRLNNEKRKLKQSKVN